MRIDNLEDIIDQLSDQELIKLLDEFSDYHDIDLAMVELENRGNKIYFKYAKSILFEKRGDVFLQASAFERIYDFDRDKAITFLDDELDNLSIYILSTAMECLCADSPEIIEKNLYINLIKRIFTKYQNLNSDEKKKIIDSFEWFKSTFKDLLVK